MLFLGLVRAMDDGKGEPPADDPAYIRENMCYCFGDGVGECMCGDPSSTDNGCCNMGKGSCTDVCAGWVNPRGEHPFRAADGKCPINKKGQGYSRGNELCDCRR